MKRPSSGNIIIILFVIIFSIPTILHAFGYKIDYHIVPDDQNLKTENKYCAVYLTSDTKLVAIDREVSLKNIYEIKKLEKGDQIAIKAFLIDQYIQLLTYMSTDTYKHNSSVYYLAFSIVSNQMMQDEIIILSKTYNELMADSKYNKHCKQILEKDIVLNKKGNIYSINLPDRVINPVIELEKIISSEENKNRDMRAERNFLETIKTK